MKYAAAGCCCAGLILVLAVLDAAAAPVDPALRFETVRTTHFAIHFHQGEEPLASRLAGIVEDVWIRMRDEFQTTPPSMTHVILADQSDLAQGWATPLPYNTIFLSASAPAGSEYIGRTDDWLRLVFIHEFTHIVHLDRSRGWARGVRVLFGRTVLSFPNLFLPTWQIEGLATWKESTLAGEGRLRAGDFRAVEQVAARAGRVEPLDRLNGGLTDWPGGVAPYAYGLGFHQYLAERFGDDALARLAHETAGSLPFLGSRAFRKIYNESLGTLWSDYVSSLGAEERVGSGRFAAEPRRLTHHGFVVLGPRFAPPRCAECPREIIYSVQGPHGFPALRRILVDGGRPEELTTRYLGSTTGVSRDLIVFDQQELRRNAGWYSDLYALERATGRVRALTREARLRDPDLSPDGRTLVAVRERRGARELVLISLDRASGFSQPDDSPLTRETVKNARTLVAEPDTQFDAPRWSPDGSAIVAERRKPNRLSGIVVVDASTGAVRPIAEGRAGRFVTPTWRPDGRAIVAAAEFGDQTFSLYELDIVNPTRPARQLTQTAGGATWPDVSPDGRTLLFVGYTPDGYDLFSMPYPSSDTLNSTPAFFSSPELAAAAPAASPPAARLAYSPWSTLYPTGWTPIVEGAQDQLRVGAAVSGVDVLSRHSYSIAATWLVTAPEGIPTNDRAEPDWQAAYAYERWRPALFASASSDTTFGAGPADPSGKPSNATLRDRSIQAGLVVPFRHVRTDSRALFSVVAGSYDYTFGVRATSLDRVSLRSAWATNTSRLYGYSISPEHGVSIGATAEVTRMALGASADATVLTGDLRGYLPGAGAHHVVALRAAAGVSPGTPLGRTFHLGGSAPAGDVIDFGVDALSLLRGFPSDAFAGTHVAILNADYRWPIARPQRGAGTWPAFLHTVHATVFTDAGHAWTSAFRLADLKVSAGGELASDVVAGYAFPLTVALGWAWGRDGARSADHGARVYVRVGRSF